MIDLRAMNLFGAAAALRAADEVGLLRELLSRPGAASELASRLSLSERATERVLDVLVGFNLAERAGEEYRAASGLHFLSEETPSGLDGLAEFWSNTAEFLRTGAPIARMDGSSRARSSAYRAATPMLGRMFEGFARALASRWPSAPNEILDVGCGSGVWSLAFLERFEGARATGLDLETVLASFRERAGALGATARVLTIAGDMHTTELPEGRFDLVIFANVLHLEPAEGAQRLIARSHRALRRGGRLLIIDALMEERPRSRSVYALHLALRTAQGAPHRRDQLLLWMREAGFISIELDDLGAEAGSLGAMFGATAR